MWIVRKTAWKTNFRHFHSARLTYEIPDEYHNSFYLANASLLQIVNYFVHAAYKVIFPELIEKVRNQYMCSPEDAAFRIRSCISHLERCDALVDVHIPMKRYSGEISLVRAHRAYHGLTFFNKFLGGLRFDAELARHNTQGFAAQQTYRNSLFGLDVGGAGGGIKYCPYVLDPMEMQSVLSSYLMRIPKFASVTDLLEPDIGTCAIEMDILKSHQALAPHVEVLGKTPQNGGFLDHTKSSGQCTVQCLKRFLDNDKIIKRAEVSKGLEGRTYILQGLGKVGKEIALMMHKEGAQCIGVREHDSVLYEPGGIHVKALFKHLAKFGTMRSFTPKCREYDLDSIFTQPCDIMILAAIEKCISCTIADRIQAKVLVEVANLPVTPTAYRILTTKNKLLIPGLLAGAGPSLMSYYEHKAALNVDGDKLDSQTASNLFNTALQVAIDDIIDIEEKFNLNFDFLQAAYIRSIQTLFKRIMNHQILQEKTNEKMIDMMV